MPAEKETTTQVTMPDSEIVNEPAKVEIKKLPIAVAIEKNIETTENEEERITTDVEEIKSENKDRGSKDDEDKENVRENQNGTKIDENKTDADKTSHAEATGQTGGVVLRKRRTPEKKESTEEDVSPPKKVK